MYFVVALALYMQSSAREVLRCLLEGLRWMAGPDTPIQVAGDAGISLARSRLGIEPVLAVPCSTSWSISIRRAFLHQLLGVRRIGVAHCEAWTSARWTVQAHKMATNEEACRT